MYYVSFFLHMLLLLRPRSLDPLCSRMAPELFPLAILCLSDFFLSASVGSILYTWRLLSYSERHARTLVFLVPYHPLLYTRYRWLL